MLKTICPRCKREVYLCDRIFGRRLVLDPTAKVYAPMQRRTWDDKTTEDAVETTMAYVSHADVCRPGVKKS